MTEREKVRLRFLILLPVLWCLNICYLLSFYCNFQSMDTGTGLYNIYEMILTRFEHFDEICANNPLTIKLYAVSGAILSNFVY